jgi:hypothetical protein
MAGKIGELCQRLPAARARFTEHRDVAAAASSIRAYIDFVVLNEQLGETDRTVAWLDGLSADQRRSLPDSFVDLKLVPLLIKRDRWVDAGTLLRDPLADLRRRVQYSVSPARLYKHVGELHRCLIAAGRAQDAAAVRDEALTIEDSAGMRNALR